MKNVKQLVEMLLSDDDRRKNIDATYMQTDVPPEFAAGFDCGVMTAAFLIKSAVLIDEGASNEQMEALGTEMAKRVMEAYK